MKAVYNLYEPQFKSEKGDNMFGQKRKVSNKADKLVKVAQVCMMGLLVPIMEKKPILKPLIRDNGEEWDFFMTIAAIALCALNPPETIVPSKHRNYFLEELDKALFLWNRNAPGAVANLGTYLNNFFRTEMPPHWGFGCWVIHNLKGSEPTHAELDLGAALGELLEKQYKPQIMSALG